MSYVPIQRPDLSVVTRLRLLAAAQDLRDVRPSLERVAWVILSRAATAGSIAALHLATAAIFFVPLALAGESALAWRGLPLDDAWIHMVYARSFSEGFDFLFNPGVQEAGATSLLWPMLVGVFHNLLSSAYGPWALTEAEAMVTTARALGLVLAIGTSLVALTLVARITGSRLLGMAAAALIALDPTYSFAKIAGVEASLFGFLALAAATAFYCNRLTLTGGLLALTLAARPEGLLLVFLALGALMLRVWWDREDLRLAPGEDIPQALRVAGLPLVVALGIAAHNASINGDVYPNSYLVRHVSMGLFDAANLSNVVRGYLWSTPYFGGAGMLVVPLLVVVSALWCLKQVAFRALPLVLFPLALYYSLSVMVPVEAHPWGIATRRYLDSTLPFIAVALVVGLHAMWVLMRRLRRAYARSSPARRLSLGPRPAGAATAMVFIGLAAAPLAAMPAAWVALVQEHRENTLDVEYANAATARWIDANLPPDAVIGAVNPGALRFFSQRRVVDLTGINTYAAIGKPVFEAAQQEGVDYIAARRNIYLDSWPLGREVFAHEPPGSAAGGEAGMVVYQAMWDRQVILTDSTVPHIVNTAGLVRLDALDVGQPVSEEGHQYHAEPTTEAVDRIVHLTDRDGHGIDIWDDARPGVRAEAFTVRTLPGQELIVVRRYDVPSAGAINVYVGDTLVGRWDLAAQRHVLGEDYFLVPAAHVTGGAATLRFEHVPSPGAAMTSFHYWFYTTPS